MLPQLKRFIFVSLSWWVFFVGCQHKQLCVAVAIIAIYNIEPFNAATLANIANGTVLQ